MGAVAVWRRSVCNAVGSYADDYTVIAESTCRLFVREGVVKL